MHVSSKVMSMVSLGGTCSLYVPCKVGIPLSGHEGDERHGSRRRAVFTRVRSGGVDATVSLT